MFKSVTSIALKFSLSILTLLAVVCLPNKVNPFAPTWAAIWAAPVSFATINELSCITLVNWEISKAFPLSNILIALIFFASLISLGPGAVIILYSSPNLLTKILINLL